MASVIVAGYSEDALIEQPAIALLAELGWQTFSAFHEFGHGPLLLISPPNDGVPA